MSAYMTFTFTEWLWYYLPILGTIEPPQKRRQWHPTPVLLPGKSHGRRSLVGCSPWGHKELDTTERLYFYFSLSCIGEGNGNPLSVLAWRIPGTVEPDVLLSMRSHRVRHDWRDLAAAAAALVWSPHNQSITAEITPDSFFSPHPSCHILHSGLLI